MKAATKNNPPLLAGAAESNFTGFAGSAAAAGVVSQHRPLLEDGVALIEHVEIVLPDVLDLHGQADGLPINDAGRDDHPACQAARRGGGPGSSGSAPSAAAAMDAENAMSTERQRGIRLIRMSPVAMSLYLRCQPGREVPGPQDQHRPEFRLGRRPPARRGPLVRRRRGGGDGRKLEMSLKATRVLASAPDAAQERITLPCGGCPDRGFGDSPGSSNCSSG